jgi:hypothetical protein
MTPRTPTAARTALASIESTRLGSRGPGPIGIRTTSYRSLDRTYFGEIHDDGPTLHVLPSQASDGVSGLVVIRHFYKTEALRLAGGFILNDGGFRDKAALAEELGEVFVGNLVT